MVVAVKSLVSYSDCCIAAHAKDNGNVFFLSKVHSEFLLYQNIQKKCFLVGNFHTKQQGFFSSDAILKQKKVHSLYHGGGGVIDTDQKIT